MTTLGVQGKIFKMGLLKKHKGKMFVLPSKTSKMIKSHEVSNKNFKNRTADNVLKIQSSQNDYPGSSSVNIVV